MFGRRYLILSLISVFMVTLSPMPTVRAQAADGGPEAFIRSVGPEAINSLTGKELSDKERKERFRSILNRVFDIDWIARFTLGLYWRRATEAQRKEYVGLFEDFIVQAYAARFKAYNGETFDVSGVRDINDGDKLVRSTVAQKDGRPILVQWRVRGDNSYKIIDVIVEGVSMAITHRDEFTAIISRNGGKIEGLLATLRKKTGMGFILLRAGIRAASRLASQPEARAMP